MILPYSTDAPIYYFPWMTIVLIVVNGVTFAITGMGLHSDGWLLQYGNGLHPVEWLAYSFLHFGPMHLIGNMFFLWAFGIVVEGKLGWWKFLALYLGIGVTAGALIQVAMLGYRPPLDVFAEASSPPPVFAWLEPAPVMAQDNPIDPDDDGAMAEDFEGDLEGEMPAGDIPEEGEEFTPEDEAALREHLMKVYKPGAGGASLVVFALLGIVLVWAPKNEVSCFFLIGFRAGTFEMEYLYFCGFKIVSEIIGMVMGVRGFEVTSEVGHVVGICLGFGTATLFLKRGWVDCENWDLFAYLQNKHGSMVQVGTWQDAAIVPRRRAEIATPEDDESPRSTSAKKKRAKSKLVELKSLDEDVPEEEPDEAIEVFDDDAEPAPRPVKPAKRPAPTMEKRAAKGSAQAQDTRESGDTAVITRIRAAIQQGQWNEALAELRRRRATDRSFELPRAELAALADGFFKAQNVRDSRPLLEEYIQRFPEAADRQRVKLAVLFVKFLKRPTAAAKLLAAVDRSALSEDYQAIYQRAGRQAQQMISDGIIDAS